ncbi:hypothetical protein BGZ72_002130 [Mortierella alpina]|nr:hypothetical protein BGZ72_002130 [Mortierella alpina]
MTPIQPALTVLTAGVDGSHSASLVSSTGVELRGMLATLRTRSGKTPVGMRSEGAETQELRSLKSLLPLNEDVQRTFILLAELARSETWEKKSKFPTRLRAPLFKCAKVALLTRSTGYMIEDNFFVHLQTIMPYNKFTLKKLIYKNILPAWLRELELQKVALVAKFKTQVLAEGAPPSETSMASGTAVVTESGLRLLLWEIMEKSMEIRASTKELHQIDSTTFPANQSEFHTRRMVYDEDADKSPGRLPARLEAIDDEQNRAGLVNPASESMYAEISAPASSATEKPAALDTQNPASAGSSASAQTLTEYRPISPAESPESAHATLAWDQPPADAEPTKKTAPPADPTTQMETGQVETEAPAEAEHANSESGTCPQNPVVISDASPIQRRQSFHASVAQRVPIVLRRQLFSEPAPTTLVASAMGPRQRYPLHRPPMFPLPLSPLSPLTSYDGSATGAEPSHGPGSAKASSSSSSQSRVQPTPLSPNPIPLSAPVHQAIYDALLHAQGGPTKRIRRPYSDPTELTEMVTVVQEGQQPYVEIYPSQHSQQQARRQLHPEHEQYHPYWPSSPPQPPQQHQQQQLGGQPEYDSVAQRERIQLQLREQIQMRQQDRLQLQIKEQREKQHRIDRERRLRDQLEHEKGIWEREQLRLAMQESEAADQRAMDEAYQHQQQQQRMRVLFEKSVQHEDDNRYELQQVGAMKQKKKKQAQEDEEEDDEEERKLLQQQEQRVQLQAQKLLEEQTRLVQLQQQKEQKKAQLKREERQRLVREAQQRRLEKQQQQTLGEQELLDLRMEKDRMETERKHKEKQQQIKARWEKELDIKLRMMQPTQGQEGVQEAAPKARGRPRRQQQQQQQQRLLPKSESKLQQQLAQGLQRSRQFQAGIVLQSPKTAGRQMPPPVTSAVVVVNPAQNHRTGPQAYPHGSRPHPYHPSALQSPQPAPRPSHAQPILWHQGVSLQQQQQRQQQAQRQHQGAAAIQSTRELSPDHPAPRPVSGHYITQHYARNGKFVVTSQPCASTRHYPTQVYTAQRHQFHPTEHSPIL